MIRALFPFATISELDAGHWGTFLFYISLFLSLQKRSVHSFVFFPKMIDYCFIGHIPYRMFVCLLFFLLTESNLLNAPYVVDDALVSRWFRRRRCTCGKHHHSLLQYMPRNQTTLSKALLTLYKGKAHAGTKRDQTT